MRQSHLIVKLDKNAESFFCFVFGDVGEREIHELIKKKKLFFFSLLYLNIHSLLVSFIVWENLYSQLI